MSISEVCKWTIGLPKKIYSFFSQESLCAKICFGHFKNLKEEIEEKVSVGHQTVVDVEEFSMAETLFAAREEIIQYVGYISGEILLDKIRDKNFKLYDKLLFSKKNNCKKLYESIQIFAKACKRTAYVMTFCFILSALLAVGIIFEIIQRIKVEYNTLAKIISNILLCSAVIFLFILFFLSLSLYDSAKKHNKVLHNLSYVQKGMMIEYNKGLHYSIFNPINSILLFFMIFFISFVASIVYLQYKNYDFANFVEQDIIIVILSVTLASVSLVSLLYVVFGIYAKSVIEKLNLKFHGKDKVIFQLLNSDEKAGDKKKTSDKICDILSNYFAFVEAKIDSNIYNVDIKHIFLTNELADKLQLSTKQSLMSAFCSKSHNASINLQKCLILSRLERFLIASGCEQVTDLSAPTLEIKDKVHYLILEREKDGLISKFEILGACEVSEESKFLNIVTESLGLVVHQGCSGKLTGWETSVNTCIGY